MSKVKWQAVQELIREKRYDEARAILRTMQDPKAVQLLAKLDVQSADAAQQRANWWLVLGALPMLIVLVGVVLLAAQPTPQSSLLPTQIVLPSPTPTEAATPTPFYTWTPRPTLTPVPTQTPSHTATPTQSATPTNTHTPTITETPVEVVPSPASDALQLTTLPPSVYYVSRTANVRTCPDLTCSVLAQLNAGAAVGVDALAHGTVVNNSDLWYRTSYGGQIAFIHSTLVTQFAPQPTAIIVQPAQPIAPPVFSSQPTPVPAVGGSNCDCSRSCSQMFTCAEAYYQLNTCGCTARDQDRDGVPCESLCNP